MTRGFVLIGLLIWGLVGVSVTAERGRAWTSEPAIWAAAIAHPNTTVRAWVNYGNAMACAGRRDEAQRAYIVAIGMTRPDQRDVKAIITANRTVPCRALTWLQTGRPNLRMQGVGV